MGRVSFSALIAGVGDRTATAYDGFDRPKTITDPLGNQTINTYDPASNVVRIVQTGDPVNSVPGSTNIRTLAVTETVPDELSRTIATHQVLFQTPYPAGSGPSRTPTLTVNPYLAGFAPYLTNPPLNNAPVPGVTDITVLGRVSTLTEYDRDSRPTFTIAPNLGTSRTDSDGLGRVVQTTDSALTTGFTGFASGAPGTIAAASNTPPSLRISSPTWSVNQWQNGAVLITSGLGAGQVRRITDNTANQLDLAAPWTVIPSSGDGFLILPAAFNPYGVTGNVVQTAYDADSNPIETKESDYTTVPNVAFETFVTTSFYDSLNRLQTVVDNLGQATDNAYDSRGNLVAQADANGPVGSRQRPRRGLGGTGMVTVNNYGFVTLNAFDGLNRPVESDTLLPAHNLVDGTFLGADGNGIKQMIPSGYLDTTQAGDGLISTYSAYDADSQLLASRDDNGSTTASVYDNQNRTLTELKGQATGYQGTTFTVTGGDRGAFNVALRGGVTVQAQPTSRTVNDYDGDGHPMRTSDESGNQFQTTFDALDRPTRTQITLAAGFYGTTLQSAHYDGLSRTTQASTDNQGPSTGTVTTQRFYDSVSRPVEEQHQIGSLSKAVSWNYDSAASGSADSPSAELYPAVSDNAQKRQLDNQFDTLGRLVSRQDHRFTAGTPYTPLGTVQYIGPDRVATRTYPNSVRLTYIGQGNGHNADVGYDGLGRPIKQVWEKFTSAQALGSGTLRIGFGYQNSAGPAYDRSGNRLLAEKLHDPGNAEVYTYRAGAELSSFKRGTLNMTKTDVATFTTTPGARQSQTWTLDGLGNWGQTVSTNQGSTATTESRNHTTLNAIQNITINGGTPVPYVEDANGNLLDDGTRTFKYDALNRVHQVYRKIDHQLIAEYLYDADGRRVETVISNGGLENNMLLDGTTTLWYSGWNVIEEEDGSGNDLQQYVYGAGPNELWALDNRRTGTSVDQLNAPTGDYRNFYLTDPEGSVYGLTNQSGDLKEAYQYDPYGVQTVISPGSSESTVTFTMADAVAVGGYSQLANQVVNPYLFTGQRVDRETGGEYDYNNRIYSPVLGRFLQEDPLGGLADSNFYRYVSNSPTNLTDPSGLDWGWPWEEGVSWHPRDWLVTKGVVAAGKGVATAGKAVVNETAEKAALFGDLGQAGVAGIYIGFGGEAYEPDWWSTFARQAPKMADREATQAYLIQAEVTNLKEGAMMAVGGKAAEYGGKTLTKLLRRGVVAEEKTAAKALTQLEGVPVGTASAPGAQVTIGGVQARELSRRLTVTEMAAIQRNSSREAAQIYLTGPGTNGGGGTYYLIQGTQGNVSIPLGSNVRWINHTHPAFHPSGAPVPLIPSQADRDVLRFLQQYGSPQRTSQIVPEVGQPFLFQK